MTGHFQGIALHTPPNTGDFAQFDGTKWIPVPAPGGASAWSAVLAVGNTSGGTSPNISDGDVIQFLGDDGVMIGRPATGANIGGNIIVAGGDNTDAAGTGAGGDAILTSGQGGGGGGGSGDVRVASPDSTGLSGSITIETGDVSTPGIAAGPISLLGGDGGGGEFGTGASIIAQPGISDTISTAGGIFLNHAGGQTAIRVAQEATGHVGGQAIIITDAGLAFFNGSPAVQPSITGSRGGNAALASLITALATMGLVTDNTTA